MPTGYTSELQERDVPFAEFVWRCARAFGALIMMREDPMDVSVPQRFEPDKFYSAANTLAAADYDTAHKRYLDDCARIAATRDRYERMLAQVRAWTPPSSDHEGLKEFMREQIETSIHYDCHEPTPPTKLAGPAWLERAIESAERSLAYAEKALADEEQRIAERNAWIAALRASVPPQGGAQ